MEWTIPEISNLRCRWGNICLDTIRRQMVGGTCEWSWGTGWYACFLCSQEICPHQVLRGKIKSKRCFIHFRKHRRKWNIYFSKKNMQELLQRHFAGTVALSNSHDIRAAPGLIVALSSSVQCYLLLKQQKNPIWPIYLFSYLWCIKVSDFTWSHDGTQALISYRDGFVLVGSVSGQRHWSSEINLESQITCGIWTPDDQQVMALLDVLIVLRLYAIEYIS